ncbi:multicopper oxidase family protein [Psychromarinibacter halotolerans]|uniref:Multicopper oxidase family protein n=1 Tax=Psychromarinibacter halotolerans TaxID=1775175 RepID=A0ABV7GSG3_9RHOB|nr:multicopper oxidase domain-containing protein [Psychromarinibacter halotolerans]MDF0596871.1 multicopper oxidase domain-containing protein [Psychromarinibacter halotolerans]
MTRLSRRGFLAASAAMSASLVVPARARAASDSLSLVAETRTIDVNGRAATVMGLTGPSGQQGLTLSPGQRFQVELLNGIDTDTIIHWHGQIPPNAQDGAPNTNRMLTPGERRAYDFAARPGTYWMHSHIPQQEIAMLAAPLIVRSPEDVASDRQEVVMFLHDFSFLSPEEVISQTARGTGGHHGMAHAPTPVDHGAMHHNGDNAAAAPDMPPLHGMDATGAMPMDLNDFDFDAYLVNDRTLEDPEIVPVESNGRIRLRIINAASMTAFWIDTGDLTGRLVAVDGDHVQSLPGTRFPIAPGQRLEIDLDLPGDGIARPVLALREGAHEQTGLVLAPAGAPVSRLSSRAKTETPPVAGDMRMELAMRAMSPLSQKQPDDRHMVMLGGSMSPYVWTINGSVWNEHTPISVAQGARVAMMFHNMSMMAHPMHLHGHVFQVIAIGGQSISGALRDTVLVPAMGSVTVAFDAGEAAAWMMHCHHMGHLATGMMTELQVRATA